MGRCVTIYPLAWRSSSVCGPFEFHLREGREVTAVVIYEMLAGMGAKKAAETVQKTGGLSRIAKEDGRPAVEAWLDHVKPEQRSVVRRIDALILETVPDAVCAVKFRKPTNSWGVPFYGLSGKGWIVSVNSLKAQVRLIFFAGNVLKPIPPLAAPPRARAVDVHSDSELDGRQIKAWLQQAKKLPGWGRL
jgi:hypothetical protein